MSEKVSIISDRYFSHEFIKSNLVEYDAQKIIILDLDLEKMDETRDKISNLSGAVACFMGPGSFGFEKLLLFQIISSNKLIHQFKPSWAKDINAGKWSWISAETHISSKATIGAMCFIGNNTTVSAGVQIGNFSWIDEFVVLGVGAKIGKHVTILKHVSIGSTCNIIPYTELHHNIVGELETGGFIDNSVLNTRADIINVKKLK